MKKLAQVWPPLGALLVLFAFALAIALPGARPCFADTDSRVEIHAPGSVGVGQPFLVRVAFPYLLDDLEIFWDGRSVRPEIEAGEGGCRAVVLLGADLKAKPAHKIIGIEASVGGKKSFYKKGITIVDRAYQSESLSVDPDMLHPPESERERIERERELVLGALRTASPKRMWRAPFSLPVKGKMLSRYGLHRVFNGQSKRRHKGLDFRAWQGTPIHSIAPGRVLLVGDYYFAGNCAIVDHGNGVLSMYVHMSKVLVKQGQDVKRGQKIGLSGATGRATGAHLHLGVCVQGVAVDPEPLFTMDER